MRIVKSFSLNLLVVTKAFEEYDLSLWLIKNMCAPFLLGMFIGLTDTLFYESNKNYIATWLFETVISRVVEKMKKTN